MNQALLYILGAACILCGVYFVSERNEMVEDDEQVAQAFSVDDVISNGIYEGAILYVAAERAPWSVENGMPEQWQQTSNFSVDFTAPINEAHHQISVENLTLHLPQFMELKPEEMTQGVTYVLPATISVPEVHLKIVTIPSEQESFSSFQEEQQRSFVESIVKNPIDPAYFFFDYETTTLASGESVLLHQRNFYSPTGKTYTMMIWNGDGTVTVLSGEGSFETLNMIFSSVRKIR